MTMTLMGHGENRQQPTTQNQEQQRQRITHNISNMIRQQRQRSTSSTINLIRQRLMSTYDYPESLDLLTLRLLNLLGFCDLVAHDDDDDVDDHVNNNSRQQPRTRNHSSNRAPVALAIAAAIGQ